MNELRGRLLQLSKRLDTSTPPPASPPTPTVLSLAASCVSSPSPPRLASPRAAAAAAAAYKLPPPRSLTGPRRQLPLHRPPASASLATTRSLGGGGAPEPAGAMWRGASLPSVRAARLESLKELYPASHPPHNRCPPSAGPARWSDSGLLAQRGVHANAPLLRISGGRCVSVRRESLGGSPSGGYAAP